MCGNPHYNTLFGGLHPLLGLSARRNAAHSKIVLSSRTWHSLSDHRSAVIAIVSRAPR